MGLDQKGVGGELCGGRMKRVNRMKCFEGVTMWV